MTSWPADSPNRMDLNADLSRELSRFPEALRTLVNAELAAGNTIAELGHGFPAAPCGAYVKLAQPVRSRPREKSAELDFYDRNSSSYSGEFTDATRHFFVLEPPRPPDPEPDTNAIRAKLESEYIAANQSRLSPNTISSEVHRAQLDPTHARSSHVPMNPIVAKFKASMTIDYEKWHDGIGYDLDLMKRASPSELAQIEEILLLRRCEDWRDIEALAALDSERAKDAIKQALRSGNATVRMAVHTYAPELLTESQRVRSLVQALEQADFYEGLSQALSHASQFHPPEVTNALLRGIMDRDGSVACHFAAMLYFIHGKSSSPFDWEHRPFFLRFNTENPVEREKAARELFATLGVDADRYVKRR